VQFLLDVMPKVSTKTYSVRAIFVRRGAVGVYENVFSACNFRENLYSERHTYVNK
jgi:hypothetical protein